MLIRRRDGELLLVTQVEHARLSGEIAGRWGNDCFSRPRDHESARFAAERHDEGWRAYDEQPLFNAEARRPLHFLEIAMGDHIPLYGEGVDRVFAVDTYAGLLVSMHWTGLYRSRWGLQSGRIEFADDADQDAVVDREERRWIAAKRELTRSVRRSDLELSLWHNYDLLQAWDVLSLYVCLIEPAPADAPVRTVIETLKGLEQDGGERTVGSVPPAPGAERVDLRLRPLEPGVVAVDPYPFDTDELVCSVSATAIPDRAYADADDAREAIAVGRQVTIGCRLVAAGGKS